MRIALPLIAAFALASCGQAPDEAPSADGEIAETPMPVEPDGGIGDGAGPPGDTQAALDTRIPTRFHGVWDYIEGSCDPASDMRMEISGTEILFYESIGLVTDVEAEEDIGAVVLTLAMEGEGETWEQKTRLMLTGEGASQRLETSDGEGPVTVDEYPQKRCPS